MSFTIRGKRYAEIERHLDSTDPNQAKENLLREARKDQQNWEKEGNTKKKYFRIFLYASAIIGGTTTGLILILTLIGITDPTKAIITGILTAGVTVASAILAIAKYDKWGAIYVLAAKLKREIINFDSNTGDYGEIKDDQIKRNKLFADRLANLQDQYNAIITA